MRGLRLMMAIIALLVAVGTATVIVGGNRREATVDDATTRVQVRELRAEFIRLAEAWDEGGGRYGYPFWEKAYQQWRDHEISAGMLREYAASYRATLEPGCDRVAAVNVSRDDPRAVQDLIVEACDERQAALELQEELLVDVIEPDIDASPDDVTERRTQLEGEFQERLQLSYALTREAMNHSQQSLTEQGVAALPEDSFV